ncbi:MAG: YkgJ family cysteine cluster protein [Pseudomonadota bacterium]
MTVTAADVETMARDAALAVLAADPFDLAGAARTAIAEADRAMDALRAVPEVAGAVNGAACRKGCGWCCHQVVGITAAEEEMVVAAARALPPDVQARVRARHCAAEARLNSIPVDRWQGARVPCPMLDDGACAIHADRPLPCRAVLSADEAACRSWHDGEDGARIPLVAAQRRVYSAAQAGLAQALAAAGIPPGPVSLIEALDLGLRG